jgi:hypothetical protein
MDLSPRTTTSGHNDEKQWLGSKHGTDATRTITLDITNGGFEAGDLVVGDAVGFSYIRSGVPLKKHAATGLYRRNTTTAACDGHLFESVRIKVGDGATTKAGAALHWHGVVVDAQVPGTFVDADRAPHILYV